MSIRPLLAILPLAGLLAGSVGAQSPREAGSDQSADPHAPRTQRAFSGADLGPDGLLGLLDGPLVDEPVAGEVWARGRNYKASFDATGFSFIPFLGSQAPQNYPVHLDLVGLRAGGEAASLDAREGVQAEGSRVELARGSIVEVYHLGLEQVEQTFVFHERPSAGELVLELEVTTELAMRANAGGWTFENELGGVRYGAAKAIDGAGRVRHLEQRQSPRGIEIVVPADFVASAELPLVVDPVLETFDIVNDPSEQVRVDVAFDPQTDQYLLVYETAFSFLDHDILSLFFDVATQQLLGLGAIDLTSARWADPQVAGNYAEQAFLVVATEGSLIGSRRVLGRVREASVNLIGPVIEIGAGLSDDSYPDVGGFGNDTGTLNDFMVVFQRMNLSLTESSIVAQVVSGTGNLIGPVVQVANVAGQRDQKPRISQSSGTIDLNSAEHRYMVVWEREESPTNRDIWTRVIEPGGSLTGHPRYRAYSFSDALDPVVSSQGFVTNATTEPYWVIVFERLLGSDYDIFAVVAENDDAYNARNVSNMQDVDQQLEQADPRITQEYGDYLIVYTSENSGGGMDAYFTVLNVVSDGQELRTGVSTRRDPLRELDGSVRDLAIASDYFDLDGPGINTGFAPWVAEGNMGSDGDVGAALVVDSLADTVGSQYCEANPNSTGQTAWINARFGEQSPFNVMLLRCTELPPDQFGLFANSMGNAVTSNPGGSAGNLCLSGSIGRYSDQVASTGPFGQLQIIIDPQSLEQPNGPVSALAGEAWYFQCWVRDVENGVPTSNFSNGIAVTFL